MTDLQIVGFYILFHYQKVIIIKRRPGRCFRIVLLVLIRAPVTSASHFIMLYFSYRCKQLNSETNLEGWFNPLYYDVFMTKLRVI